MAHFAELDDNNIVLRVLVVSNDITTPSKIESEEDEQLGITFLKGLYGNNTKWKQTSYNTWLGNHSRGKPQNRKNYAGIGYIYDVTRNAFIAPSPFRSWILNENTCTYEAPVPCPDDGDIYRWNEATRSWIKI